MKLTNNFRLSEFVVTKHSIKLEPTGMVLNNIIDMAQDIMQPIRDYFDRPLIITSGYRNNELNEKINGHPASKHLEGLACDFYIRSGDHRMNSTYVGSKILRLDLPISKIVVYPNEKRLHIQKGFLLDNKLYLKFESCANYHDFTDSARKACK